MKMTFSIVAPGLCPHEDMITGSSAFGGSDCIEGNDSPILTTRRKRMINTKNGVVYFTACSFHFKRECLLNPILFESSSAVNLL